MGLIYKNGRYYRVKIDCPIPIGSYVENRLSSWRPEYEWVGTTWELEEEDATTEATTDETKLGTIGSESLPNIKGATDKRGARFGWYSTDSCEGAISKGQNGPTRECSGGDNSHNGIQLFFDASKGQVDSDGNYVPQAQSTYQNGAPVKTKRTFVYRWWRLT